MNTDLGHGLPATRREFNPWAAWRKEPSPLLTVSKFVFAVCYYRVFRTKSHKEARVWAPICILTFQFPDLSIF